MKSWMLLVLATGCVAGKVTHYRSAGAPAGRRIRT